MIWFWHGMLKPSSTNCSWLQSSKCSKAMLCWCVWWLVIFIPDIKKIVLHTSRYLFIVIYDSISSRFILWGNWLDSNMKHLNSMDIGWQPIVSSDFCPNAHICIAGGLAWMLIINLIPYVHWYNWLFISHIQIILSWGMISGKTG